MIMKTMKIGDLTNKIGSGVTPRGGQKVYQSIVLQDVKTVF